MLGARRATVALVAVSFLLVGCGSNPAATAATPTLTPAPSPTQNPRTLTFKLNACTDPTICNPLNEGPSKFGQGTVVVDIETYAYTITVNVTGLTPNSRHLINFHFGSCASPDLDPPYDQIDVAAADTTGTLTSVTTRQSIYLVPGNGLILTVHGDDTSRRETHIACIDLTN